MDPLKMEKIQAMKRYKRGTQEKPFVNYAVTTLILVLFVFSPIWIPEFLTTLKLFLLESLPSMVTFLFGPKFFFIICNVIVLFLVLESKLSRGPSLCDVYEEKVRNNLSYSYKKPCNVETKTYFLGEEERERDQGEKETYLGFVDEERDLNNFHKRVEDYIARGVNEQKDMNKFHKKVEGCIARGVEDQKDLNELHKKVEDYIARVKWQRKAEAKMFLCY
ncbi:hypothetical protein LUZ60_002052 [Juncus effusus]|nr:hypothetical protein LUZ60_002052 [Juncus effusus]